MTQFAFFKGRIVPIEEAKISVMTHALNYGTACFEGIRAYWNADEEQLFVFQLRAHYERLLRSMGIMLMERRYSAEELSQILPTIRGDGPEAEGHAFDSPVRNEATISR